MPTTAAVCTTATNATGQASWVLRPNTEHKAHQVEVIPKLGAPDGIPTPGPDARKDNNGCSLHNYNKAEGPPNYVLKAKTENETQEVEVIPKVWKALGVPDGILTPGPDA